MFGLLDHLIWSYRTPGISYITNSQLTRYSKAVNLFCTDWKKQD